MASAPELLPPPRPGEKVRRYLEEMMGRSEEGGRLPTIDQIAGHLGVSASTVRGVVRQYRRKGVLETRKGHGTILRRNARGRPLTIGVNLLPLGTGRPHRPHRLDWQERIYLGASRKAALTGQPVSLLPVMPSNPGPGSGEGIVETLIQAASWVDLLLLFPRNIPAGDLARVEEAFEREGKGVIHINPPSLHATANFVSAGFFDAAFRIGQAWHDGGRRRILFLVHHWFSNSVSARLYLAGLSCGVRRDEDPSVSFRVLTMPTTGHESGVAAARRLLAGPEPLPDAIFCFGDLLAEGCLAVFREAGVAIPEAMSLVGGTGLTPAEGVTPRLCSILQPMEAIGEAAMGQLIRRIHEDNAPVPGLVLPCDLSPGETMRPAELDAFSNPSIHANPTIP